MTQFHAGQDVEVRTAQREASPAAPYGGISNWCKAKIVNELCPATDWPTNDVRYQVQFPDGTRAVFDAAHIRAVFVHAPITVQGDLP